MITYRQIPRKKHQILLSSALTGLRTFYYSKLRKLPLLKIGIAAGAAAALIGGAALLWPVHAPVPPERVVDLIGKTSTPKLHPDRPYVSHLTDLITKIANGRSVNATDSEGNTALILAARLHNRAALCWLVAKGADANRKNDAGRIARDYVEDEKLYALLSICMSEEDDLSDTAGRAYALTAAEWNSHLHGELSVERLRECAEQLKAGGDATQLAADTLTRGQEADIYLAYLLRHGADLPQARKLLHQDTLRLPQEVSAYLQALGHDTTALTYGSAIADAPTTTNPKARDAQGNTALLRAIAAHDAVRVQEQLTAGAEVNLHNKAGYTPLLLAIDNCTEENGPEIVRMLIAAGANMEAQRNEENAITQFVLNAGALATKPDFERHLPALEQTLQHMVDAKVYVRPHLLLLLPKAEPGVTISPHLAKFAERLIAAGADAKLTSFGNRRAGALSTVGCCDADMAQKLIDMGASVNQRTGNGSTPLMGAQNAEVARVFVRAGATIDAADNAGRTALDYAITAQDPERVKLLLTEGASLNRTNATGASPLHTAVSSCSGPDGLKIVNMLLSSGAGVNSMDKEKNAPLHYAIIAQNPELTKILLDAGANANGRDAHGYTPLLRAVDHCTTSMHGEGAEIVRLLLDAGANPYDMLNDPQRGNHNAISLTLRRLDHDLLKTGYTERYVPALHRTLNVMLKAGVELAAHSGSLMPAAMCTAALPSELTEIARELATGELNVNSRNYGQFTPLMCIGALDAKITKKLLAGGADPNARAERNWTTLHSAQTPEVAETLLKAGADPNIETSWQSRGTPLRNAVRMAPESVLPELAEALVNGGAAVKGNGWDIMRDLSQRELSFRTFRKLASLFTEHGADINTAWNGLYPAKLLISLGASVSENILLNPAYARDAEALVKAGANINARDGYGNTPLMNLVAAGNGIVDRWDMDALVKLYLELGADASLTNSSNVGVVWKARRKALIALENNGISTTERILAIIDAYGAPNFQDTIPDRMRLEYLRKVLIEQKRSIPREELTTRLIRATRPEMVELLLEAGGDPNATEPDGTTLLMKSGARNAKLAKQLLSTGANPKQSRKDGNTALHFASPEVAPLLIEAGADPAARNNAGRTPLEEAIYRLSPEDVKAQLAVADTDLKAQNPLRVLADRNDVTEREHNRAAMNVLRLLREAGADINIIWTTPLVYKAALTAPDMIELGANAQWRDAQGRTTLMLSPTQPGSLYQHGHVDMNATDNDGNTALMHMVQGPFDHAYLVKEYAARGADFTILNKAGLSAMDLAAKGAYAKTAVPALEPYFGYTWEAPAAEDIIAYADTEEEPQNETEAMEHRLYTRIADIASGADINATDDSGDTALILSLKLNKRLPFCWLIAKGADVNRKNAEGKTALDLATTIATRELLTLCAEEHSPLSRHDHANLNTCARTPDDMHKTLFRMGRYAEALATLLKAGAAPTKPGPDGSLLVEHDMPLETLAYLLRRGYDPNTLRADGKLPARNIRTRDSVDMDADAQRLLVAMGMRPAKQDKFGTLCLAIICDDADSVEEILGQSPNLIRRKTPGGAPLLSLAPSPEMVIVLTDAGADAKEAGLLSYFTDAAFETVQCLLDVHAAIPTAKEGEPSILHRVSNAALIPLLVQAGADVNHHGIRGETPLFDAVCKCQADKVEALLKAGADPNAANKDGQSPLEFKFGTTNFITTAPVRSWVFSTPFPDRREEEENRAHMGRVMKLLLDAGAHPTAQNWYGVVNIFKSDGASEYLTDAVKREMVESLLPYKETMPKDILARIPSMEDMDDFSPEQHTWLVNRLLNAGADPKGVADSFDDKGLSALMTAGNYSASIVKRLIDGGADPKAASEKGLTALHTVRTAEALDALLPAGVDIHAVCSRDDTHRGTPICAIAARADAKEVVPMLKKLLALGSKVCDKAQDVEWDAMQSLGMENDLPSETYVEAARLLVRAGADPYSVLNNDNEPYFGYSYHVKELAQLGVDFTRNRSGQSGTCLHSLPKWLNDFALRELMLLGIDINAVDNDGNTALMQACAQKNTRAVSLLLRNGARTDIRNKDNKTALDLAKEAESSRIVSMLEQHIYSTDSADTAKLLGLHPKPAAECKTEREKDERLLSTLITIIRNGADVNTCDDRGNTALMLAAKHYKTQAFMWLYAKGADLSLKNAQGKTAEDIAGGRHNLPIPVASKSTKSVFAKKYADMLANHSYTLYASDIAWHVREGYDINIKPTNDAAILRSDNMRLAPMLVALGFKPWDDMQRLLAAEVCDNVEWAQHLLKNHKGLISAQNPHAPLLREARSAAMAQALMDAGADPHAEIYRHSLLSEMTNPEAAQAMINAGAKLLPTDFPLHKGRNSSPDMIGVFTENGLDINGKSKWGDTPLTNAARYNQPRMFCELIKHGADPALPDGAGRTPIITAAFNSGSSDITATLLAHHIDPNTVDETTGIPVVGYLLSTRIAKNPAEVLRSLELLIRHGAKLTETYQRPEEDDATDDDEDDDDDDGIDLDPDADEEDEEADSANPQKDIADDARMRTNVLRGLIEFTLVNSVDVKAEQKALFMKLLNTVMQQYGKNIPKNALVYVGPYLSRKVLTPQEWTNLANRLLDNGADAKATFRDESVDRIERAFNGATPLMTVGVYDPALAQRLINAGTDPNAKAKNGFTALHGARSAAVVDVLIKAGADLEAVFDGRRPIQNLLAVAPPDSLPDMVALLLKAGAATRGSNWDILDKLEQQKKRLGSEAYEAIKELIITSRNTQQEVAN